MSHSDSNFYKSFAFVLGALVLFTLFIMFIANSLSPDAGEDPLAMAEQQKFIAPVGRSRVQGGAEAETSMAVQPKQSVKIADTAEAAKEPAKEPAKQAPKTETTVDSGTSEKSDTAQVAESSVAATEAATAPVAAASMKVKATVATNCAGCHNVGLDGAAKPDDAAAWNALADKGIDALAASVINGKGKMPPRAESSLSDEEIKQAVQLMISKATGAAAVEAPGAATVATATAAEASSIAAAATAVTAATTVEKEPAQVPAVVKNVVDTTCAACHISGVANAPKFGDQEAWAKRMEKGIDAVTASAIAGMGAMPPRGGSTLDDEQMKIAIEYMLSK